MNAPSFRLSGVEDRRRVYDSFEVVTLTAWAPHESQPRPLRPGSARTRLADALGSTERSAGERPGRPPA